MKYIDDESYKSAVEKQIRRLDRQDAIEAYKPIAKAKKKAYLKTYFKEKYKPINDERRRNNREAYNEYRRIRQPIYNLRSKMKKAAEKAQKEENPENPG